MSSGILTTLVKKGIFEEEKLEKYRLSYSEELGSKFKLTTDQENVVEEVED